MFVAPPRCAGDKTTGQDVFLEYRRYSRTPWSGKARHPNAASASDLTSLLYLPAGICKLTDHPRQKLRTEPATCHMDCTSA